MKYELLRELYGMTVSVGEFEELQDAKNVAQKLGAAFWAYSKTNKVYLGARLEITLFNFERTNPSVPFMIVERE